MWLGKDLVNSWIANCEIKVGYFYSYILSKLSGDYVLSSTNLHEGKEA